MVGKKKLTSPVAFAAHSAMGDERKTRVRVQFGRSLRSKVNRCRGVSPKIAISRDLPVPPVCVCVGVCVPLLYQ